MTVTGLGTARKGHFRLPILPLLSAGMVLAALVLFMGELARFAQGRDILQTDITVAGVPVTGLKLSEAVSAWERVYSQPVMLDFLGSPILLMPTDIGFHTNSDLMRADMQSKITNTNNYWVDFWNYLWRKPTSPVTTELVADYQEAKLRNFLEDVAARYEQRASSAGFDINSMTFGAGASGSRLDIEASIVEIDKALRRPSNRRVKLLMKPEGAGTANMDTLKQAITQYFTSKGFPSDGPNTIASVVVIDLQNGQEMDINPAVAYSASSTIKIPILINIFRKLDFAPDNDTKWLMGASILCSSNSASNYLIQLTGKGPTPRDQLADGLARVINTAQSLGAKNTFIDAPLDVGVKDPNIQFSIPAPRISPDTHLNTKPDPYSQTTAEDMAILLHEIYDCSEYGSGLIAAFPDNFTQNECKQMVELLSGNKIGRMIELGVPPGTRVAHKNGWGGANGGYASSDSAIVYSPGGRYILSIYTWEQMKPGQEVGDIISWETIEGISHIVYNYFNTDQPMLESRVPENHYTAIDCVMPNTKHIELLDLNNINNGRFDANGYVVPDACYNFPQCDPIPDAKRSVAGSQPAAPGTQSPIPAAPPTVAPTALPPTVAAGANLPPPTITPTLPPPPPK